MDSKKVSFIRVNGSTLKTEITEDEKKFRETQFVDEGSILKKKVNCTACGKNIKEKILNKDIHVHPVLEVLWCKKCELFYSDGEFSADEDGSDKYCRWCAQGGSLYCCSYCSVAFCEKCVRRNLPSKMMKNIEDDDWKCFVCVTDPLWSLRAVCDAAKRYAKSGSGPKSRKSTRIQKSNSEEDTTESEVSSKRSKRKRKNDTESTEDDKYNADSEDTASLETNKNKRKHASSSEDNSGERRSRRRKVDEKATKPKPHPDEKKKETFESIVQDEVNKSAALRKLLTKKETSWKKNYFGTDVTKLNETVDQCEEEFTKFFSDIKTSINLIEKSFTDKFNVLKNELNKTQENDKLSPVEENKSIVDEPEAENQDEEMADVSIVPETVITETPEESPRKLSIASVNGTDDTSLTIFDDDNTTDANDKQAETDKSRKSISDSLAVNVSSIIDSLNSDEENELGNQNASIKEKDPLESEPTKPDDVTENDAEVIISDKEDDDGLTIVEPNDPDESVLQENNAKMSLLQSSTDNATTDNEQTKKLSSGSELSGVSVLHSDQDDINKTKHKKKKTRKELDSLKSKETAASKGDADATDEDKKIERLSNLKSLKKRKTRHSSESDDKITESNAEKTDKNSSKKKKVEKASLVSYFGEASGDDTDASNVSFSRFNSVLEDKNEAFLNGEEDMSKKMLLEDSSDEEQCNDDVVSITSDDKPSKSPERTLKSDDNKSKRNESNGKSSKKNDGSNSSSEEFKKDKNKKETGKWRKDKLLRGKLSETDTSDEEKMIKRHKEREQREAERRAEKNGDSSDSEDIFRSNKQTAKKTKPRKAKVASSGSEFEVNNISDDDDDDDVQIVSDKETTPPPKSKKRRRRIKNLADSDNSGEDDESDEKTPGSASKGRKNIRKMLNEDDLAEITKRTAKEEEERKKRILERQALFNESFKIDEDINKAPDRLILDFDPETKKELIVVHKDLVKKLKPHQAKGVKFMWDSCYESVKMAEKSGGGGCILAHCMGLGKTLQVITLVHTVMRYPQLKVNRVLVLCPLSTVLNWVAEFNMWLQDVDYGDDIDVFHLNKAGNYILRADMLNNWFRNGGVMVMGYEMFRNLVNTTKVRKKIKQYFNESLLDPGPDLVVCDEGHMLKNEQSAISQATMKIRTKRRIVLTGTPLQNNLTEYHCMVQFVKKNLLGDKKEFLNRFANPITNGQYNDSTSHDVRVMKRRAHVLHKMLDGVIQRFDYNVLTPFLPSKHEFVILVSLSDLQAKLYEHYIDHYSKKANPMSTLFKDYQIMRLIWTHPYAMKLSEDRKRKIMEKKMENDDDSEGSLRDFVVHSDEESEKTSNSDSDSSVVSIRSDDSDKPKSKPKVGRLTRGKKKELGITDNELVSIDNGASVKEDYDDVWWTNMVSEDEMNDYRMGPKLVLLFAIIQQCENIGDKVLVFSQSIPSLDMIEHFLEKWEEMQENDKSEKSADQYGTWQKGIDYFRLDGQTSPELRTMYCNSFNKTSNLRSRLFLISTKAGGLGINLTAANRVIIFDASWNPSYDVQSIFRIYRFGQSKPCYVYRFLSQGTMEEKIYERQVTKLSISCRVVDEQQIDRHFNNADIVALYEFNRKKPSDEIPKLPKDRLMAEILKEHKNVIVGYHEHDSLLENQKEEELTEEERKQAWEDYENEKKGVVNMQFLLQQQQQQQQMNQMNMAMGMQNIPTEISFNKATIMEALKKEHPNVSEGQLQVMHSMVVEKLRKHYLDQLRLQQMRNAVLARNAPKQGVPMSNPFVQNPQMRNLDQQAGERFEQANMAGSSAKK